MVEQTGALLDLYEQHGHGEQEVPDAKLQLTMMCDANDYRKSLGTAVLLTGDGAGYSDRVGFHTTLERMFNHGWKVEVVVWEDSCNSGMKRWGVFKHGIFFSLDKFYVSITFHISSL